MNLYANQKDIATTFSTTDHEISNFVAILLYMGVVSLPSLDDYWAMDTRVSQVADIMSSKRFRLLRRTIHFNDNTQIHYYLYTTLQVQQVKDNYEMWNDMINNYLRAKSEIKYNQ